jgi:hypothetical protein
MGHAGNRGKYQAKKYNPPVHGCSMAFVVTKLGRGNVLMNDFLSSFMQVTPSCT